MDIKELLKKDYNLTDREIDVVMLIIEGYDNRRIAQELYLSIPTVKTHVSNAFKKTGVRNRFELMSLINSGFTLEKSEPGELQKQNRIKHGSLIIAVIAIVLFIPFLFSATRNLINRHVEDVFHTRQREEEKLFQFSETEFLINSRSIPAGLDSLTVARLFYYIGAVKEDKELWKQLLTEDWSEADIRSTWRMLVKEELEGEWSYYYLRAAEDGAEEKKYFFQRQCNGVDDGSPRPIRVIKENGEWRVGFGQP